MKTTSEHADHPQAVVLVDKTGALTEEGLTLIMTAGGNHRKALDEQMLRQELYGIREDKR